MRSKLCRSFLRASLGAAIAAVAALSVQARAFAQADAAAPDAAPPNQQAPQPPGAPNAPQQGDVAKPPGPASTTLSGPVSGTQPAVAPSAEGVAEPAPTPAPNAVPPGAGPAEPAAGTPTAPPNAAPAPSAVAAPQPVAPPPMSKRGELDTVQPARSWLGAGLAIGVLNLPKLGAGAELLGELRAQGIFPIDFGVAYFFDNDAALSVDELDLKANPLIGVTFPSGGSRVRVSAVQASAAACPYERQIRPGSLLLCLGAQGGVIRARGQGFVGGVDSTRGLFALEGYARWHFPLSDSVGVSYSAGVFVPLLRDRFGYADRAGAFVEKFRVAPVGGRLDLLLTYAY